MDDYNGVIACSCFRGEEYLMATVWGLHCRDEKLTLQDRVIAIGWPKMGDLSKLPNDRDAFKDRHREVYPEAKRGNTPVAAGMLIRFAYEVAIGDYVVYPSKSDRKINIGVIEGEYHYVPDRDEYRHQRKVKWLKHLPRTAFSQGALYETGSVLSFFRLKTYGGEFVHALDNDFDVHAFSKSDVEDVSVGATAEEIIEATRDFVLKELSKNLKGYALEQFVANLLRAMGYRATVSPQGGDSGVDITAYKDELPPRILVQVKSGDGDIRETTIQSLKGAMREGDYGVFVTLTDYTKNAKKYLDNTPIIRGINGAELVDLILKYYEDLDDEYRRLILLRKVYIPTLDIED